MFIGFFWKEIYNMEFYIVWLDIMVDDCFFFFGYLDVEKVVFSGNFNVWDEFVFVM